MAANPARHPYKILCISVFTPYFSILIMTYKLKTIVSWVPIHLGLIIKNMYCHFMGPSKPSSPANGPKNAVLLKKWVTYIQMEKVGPNRLYHCVYRCFLHQIQNTSNYRSNKIIYLLSHQRIEWSNVY